MVVPTSTEFSKALLQPLAVVDDIFARANADKPFLPTVQEHFGNLLRSRETKAKIPFLTPSLLETQLQEASSSQSGRNARLVRWRCMIQDTSMGNEVVSSQIYGSDLKMHNGLFGASSRPPFEVEESSNGDNVSGQLTSVTNLYGVTQPGQTKWSRLCDQYIVPELSEELTESQQDIASDEAASRRSVKSKLPLSEGYGVLLKVYDEDLADSFRVAETVDVLGIVDQTALPGDNWTKLGTSDAESTPPTLISALHVLAVERAKGTSPAAVDQTTRQNILDFLGMGLGGDSLCAEWVLLALTSQIHTRSAANILGALSINITGMPSTSSPEGQVPLFTQILRELCPFVTEQSLNLSHLNDSNTLLAPKSEAEESSLHAGRMQNVSGTVVLIDENTMQEGQLKEHGIANIQTLSSLFTTYKLPYAFPYSTIDMDIDYRFIVMSQGKSFLPVTAHVPLHLPDGNASALYGTLVKPSDDLLVSMRNYLQSVRMLTGDPNAFKIPSEVSEAIQEDFVQSRKAHSQTTGASSSMETQQELSRNIEIARLLSLSHGRKELAWVDWVEAKRLNDQRRLRIS